MFYDNRECSFRLIGVFFVERGAEENIMVKNRKHIALTYRIQGESWYECGQNSIHLPVGSVSFVPPGVDFKRSNTAETMIVVHMMHTGPLEQKIETIASAERFEPYFRNLLSAWEARDAFSYNHSMELLFSLFRALQTLYASEETEIPSSIRAGVELMRKEYRNASLRIADLAKACFISEVYFRKIYHNHFGESPQQTILQLRFRYALELLSSNYYSQKDAARLSGFMDVKYFRTAFKKQFGVTPSDYIKNGLHGEK